MATFRIMALSLAGCRHTISIEKPQGRAWVRTLHHNKLYLPEGKMISVGAQFVLTAASLSRASVSKQPPPSVQSVNLGQFLV